MARAVSPAPDGGYSGQNTAEGDGALFSNTGGTDNTANGFDALASNTTGNSNTAIGFEALFSNTTGVANTATGTGALEDNTVGALRPLPHWQYCSALQRLERHVGLGADNVFGNARM